MARRPRLHVAGGFYHVTLRGNHRQQIFFRDSDRDLLERIVAESAARSAAQVHAYCWMTNHIHLLIRVADVPLGKLMLRVASSYARTVQLRLDTTGHLFERRYHAALVDADRYLLAVIRYIHRNPVDAGLVSDPARYRWSSHRVYLGLDRKDWVTTSVVMRTFAKRTDHAAIAYRRLISGAGAAESHGTLPAPHPDYPQIVGDDEFVRRVTNGVGRPESRRSLDQLVQDCCLHFQVSVEQLMSRGRAPRLVAARAWLGHRAAATRAATICSVARLLGRTEGALRHAMVRHPPDPSSP
ncbi:MAG: transposase [Gammaproteobacteria bacterium]